MKFCLTSILVFFSLIGISQKLTTNDYIERYKYIAIKEMHQFKIPASITLAQAIIESGSGNSELATQANNHFGIKCHSDWKGSKIFKDDDEKNECFRVYLTPEQSFRDHSVFLQRDRYKFLFDLEITNYKEWAEGLKKAGYATNPKYPELLINLIEKYELDQYDEVTVKQLKKLMLENKIILNDSIDYNDPDHTYNFDTVANPENSLLQGPTRQILYKNRIKYIIAKKGDHITLLADELNMFEWEFYKYNEISKGSDVKPGMIVYLQPKRRKAEEKTHIVKKGETIWDISQKYGVKIEWIYKRNQLETNSAISEGQILILRGKKR